MDKIKLILIIRKMLNIGSIISRTLWYSIYIQVHIQYVGIIYLYLLLYGSIFIARTLLLILKHTIITDTLLRTICMSFTFNKVILYHNIFTLSFYSWKSTQSLLRYFRLLLFVLCLETNKQICCSTLVGLWDALCTGLMCLTYTQDSEHSE